MAPSSLRLFLEETTFYNRIVLGSLFPSELWTPIPHFLQTWLRNYIGGVLLYLVSGSLWCFYVYYLKRNVYVPKVAAEYILSFIFSSALFSYGLFLQCWLSGYRWLILVLFSNAIAVDCIPSRRAILLQIGVAMKAMPWYTLLPTVSEYMIEHGWTRCFPLISDVGWTAYLGYLLIYLVIVEFGIYWIHRELHDIKPLYKYLHATHHIYNKQNTLSPFAGLAFHPVDGILQAVPHIIALFLVPAHLTTHIALLFIEAIWTANIHDCIDGKMWPVMGAAYHTIHHTTYRHNYGHYTVWMDWMFGTLRDPSEEEAGKKVT